MVQHAQNLPGNLPTSVRELVEGQVDAIDVTTPALPGEELKIQHGLGRIPKGYIILKKTYHAMNDGESGTAWDRDFLYLKFSLDSRAITIGVF